MRLKQCLLNLISNANKFTEQGRIFVTADREEDSGTIVIRVLGADASAGERHYRENGIREGRAPDRFDEEQYLANYSDLQAAFGSNTEAATVHYIRNGFREGRTDIDGLQYIASNADLISAFGADAAAGRRHYVQFGRVEGREADTFDERQYLANYPDLQAAFGSDTDAATVHYIQYGFAEGRTDAAGTSTAADFIAG